MNEQERKKELLAGVLEEDGVEFNKIVLGGRFNATRINKSTRARHLYTTHRLRAENGTNKVLQRTLWLWGSNLS